MDTFTRATELFNTYSNILYMRSDAQPFIIEHGGDIIFNSNCNIGGAPRVWIEDNDNCNIIFSKDDWDEAIWGAEEFEYIQLRIQAIQNAIEQAVANND